jgi:hypothetical protein
VAIVVNRNRTDITQQQATTSHTVLKRFLRRQILLQLQILFDLLDRPRGRTAVDLHDGRSQLSQLFFHALCCKAKGKKPKTKTKTKKHDNEKMRQLEYNAFPAPKRTGISWRTP